MYQNHVCETLQVDLPKPRNAEAWSTRLLPIFWPQQKVDHLTGEQKNLIFLTIWCGAFRFFLSRKGFVLSWSYSEMPSKYQIKQTKGLINLRTNRTTVSKAPLWVMVNFLFIWDCRLAAFWASPLFKQSCFLWIDCHMRLLGSRKIWRYRFAIEPELDDWSSETPEKAFPERKVIPINFGDWT